MSAHESEAKSELEVWACEIPEHPDAPNVAYKGSCYACWLSALAMFRCGEKIVRASSGNDWDLGEALLETGRVHGFLERARVDPESLVAVAAGRVPLPQTEKET